MANLKKLPPEPPKPRLPGGATRPSKLVSRTGLPLVARREALNAMLLSSNCAFDAPRQKRLRPEDVALLRQVAGERFSGAHALLRRESVVALGAARDAGAIDTLTALAANPLEHGAIRGAAANALADAAPSLADLLASGLAALPRGAIGKAVRKAKPKRRTPTPDRRRG